MLWSNRRGTELWMKFLDSQVFHLLFILLCSWILNYFNKYYDFLCDGIFEVFVLTVDWCAVSFLGLLNRRRHDAAQHLRLESMNHCGPTPTRHNDAYRDANMHCSIFITSTLWMFIQIIYAFVFRYILHIFCQFILLFLDLSVDQKNYFLDATMIQW